MPLASLALLLSPLLQCLHFPVSGPCPQSPFSLLSPFAFTLSNLTAHFSSLTPSSSRHPAVPSREPDTVPNSTHHPKRNVIPASPAGTQQHNVIPAESLP